MNHGCFREKKTNVSYRPRAIERPQCRRLRRLRWKFTLGETVVKACGAWEGPPKFIHENEAVWDERNQTFTERRCYESSKG